MVSWPSHLAQHPASGRVGVLRYVCTLSGAIVVRQRPGHQARTVSVCSLVSYFTRPTSFRFNVGIGRTGCSTKDRMPKATYICESLIEHA